MKKYRTLLLEDVVFALTTAPEFPPERPRAKVFDRIQELFAAMKAEWKHPDLYTKMESLLAQARRDLEAGETESGVKALSDVTKILMSNPKTGKFDESSLHDY